MKKLGLENVAEATEREKLTANGYVCRITSVEDVPDKEYLMIEFDIAEGAFKGYYANLMEQFNFWGGRFVKSYKESALSFFKGFITAVENSNANFKFIEGDEQCLKGKLIGLVMREEEYQKTGGDIVVNVKVDEVRSVDKIRKGDFKIKPLKKLETAAIKPAELQPVKDEDLPF